MGLWARAVFRAWAEDWAFWERPFILSHHILNCSILNPLERSNQVPFSISQCSLAFSCPIPACLKCATGPKFSMSIYLHPLPQKIKKINQKRGLCFSGVWLSTGLLIKIDFDDMSGTGGKLIRFWWLSRWLSFRIQGFLNNFLQDRRNFVC